MGHVLKELRNEGLGCHEWDYMPLSDRVVVEHLIKHRSEVDPYYVEKHFPSGLSPSGDMDFREPIFVTYADLDSLIESCGLSKHQRQVVDLLMLGYTKKDVADLRHDLQQTVEVHFNRAVRRIIKENNRRWASVYAKKSE